MTLPRDSDSHSPVTVDIVPVRTALLSVSDKTGLLEFAEGLRSLGIRLISSGGTHRHLQDNGIEVIEVAQYTGFPEMLDGRVKTLHPKIHGGLLARRDLPQHLNALEMHGISMIDLAVVNLYPFEATIARPETTFAEAIEQIDIGGPSLLRSAAKNHAHVAVATSPSQYPSILADLRSRGGLSLNYRRQLAWMAFQHTANYDRIIANYFQNMVAPSEFPPNLDLSFTRKEILRYGENPHQRAALYVDPKNQAGTVVGAKQLHGKELSYNNLLDLDAANGIVQSFHLPAVAVIKHNNPCGAATNANLARATQQALAGDPLSAFGSVLGFNHPIDEETAMVLCQPGLFIEAIVAPGYSAAALELLTTKPKWHTNVRLLELLPASTGSRASPKEGATPSHRRFLAGGLLVQDEDTLPSNPLQWKTVTKAEVPDHLSADLQFGWELVRHVKSNAIVLAKEGALIGVGAGQMSRVDSVEIALKKAAEQSRGSILASDAFFPFPDSIELAARAGVAAVIQPGGSKNDSAVIEACDRHQLPMLFTSRRHFKH